MEFFIFELSYAWYFDPVSFSEEFQDALQKYS